MAAGDRAGNAVTDSKVGGERSPIYEPASRAAVPSDVGGKALGLLAIAEAGLDTPPWFAMLPGSVQADGSVSEAVRVQVAEACQRLGSGGAESFAIRSSAQDEDAPGQSFAGQYLSRLDVRGVDNVLEAIVSCAQWPTRGGVDAYRRAQGQGSTNLPLAVIVQLFVPPGSAGVAFSRAPLSGDDEVVIAATRRAGALTGGAVNGDEYRVAADDRVAVVRVDPEESPPMPGQGGTLGRVDGGPHNGRVLADEQARFVAQAARLLERRRGAPQDIEWAYSATGQLFVLQARPITALPPASSPRAQVRLWDNANIVESFPELTLPLTFSVAVGVYATVYRAACLALGVPRATVEREAPVFVQMLGLLQGRVYYNLTSWYRVLALLPGFRLTAGFLEAMMGTARPGAKPNERTVPVVARATRWWEIAGMTVRLSYRLLRFGSDAARFQASIAQLLEIHREAPAPGASPEALLADFDRFRASALRDWRAPIMNDLFLMLSHGALRRVADRWLGTDARSLVNALIVQGTVVSALPGKDLLRIAAAIRERSDWYDVIMSTPPETLRARLDAEPELAGLSALIEGYLETWGDRSPRELQLERPSYRDDPLPLLRAVRSLVSASSTGREGVAVQAALHVRRRLLTRQLGLLRVAVFSVLLRATRRHIGWREEMRLARGQVFGVGRRIFRRLGEALSDQGALERPEDVHYLSLDELRGMITGTAVVGDPRALVRLRRAQYDDYASRPRLPSRFETRGLVVDPLGLDPSIGTPAPNRGLRAWKGIGTSNGRARAPCLVVRDPTQVTLMPGHIIVARTTDPGWVPILVGAAGLLVEQGSLLSHSAIVARELGIPMVVGLDGLLDLVRTGDVLELDGSTGEVRMETALDGAA